MMHLKIHTGRAALSCGSSLNFSQMLKLQSRLEILNPCSGVQVQLSVPKGSKLFCSFIVGSRKTENSSEHLHSFWIESFPCRFPLGSVLAAQFSRITSFWGWEPTFFQQHIKKCFQNWLLVQWLYEPGNLMAYFPISPRQEKEVSED